MKTKTYCSVLAIVLLVLLTSGCYTVLMQPGSPTPESLRSNTETNENLAGGDHEYYQSGYDDYYYPFHWNNSLPPSEFIYFYGTAWWNDGYNTYLESRQENSLPSPQSFDRRGTHSESNSFQTGAGSGSGAGMQTRALNKNSTEANQSGNANAESNERTSDTRRSISRRSSTDSATQASESNTKKKKKD